MTIKIFARTTQSEPWSSIFTGMLTSLQPMRSSKPNDSTDPTTSITTDSKSLAPSTAQSKSFSSTSGGIKRRKLDTDDGSWAPSAAVTRPTASAQANSSAPRRPPKATTTPALATSNTIDRYFSLHDPRQSDAEAKPAVSLYDDIQKRVHDAEARSEDKRTLRSQNEGSRVRSELAVYFPNYDDVMGDVPKPIEKLTFDSILVLKDGTKKAAGIPRHEAQAVAGAVNYTEAPAAAGSFAEAIDQANENGAEVLDFSDVEKQVLHHPQDPMSDAAFAKSHKRAERREKQLRNIEREKAMHERVQLERLLDGLYGHDWLRVMGVSGITDSEAQKFQGKREYFIREVRALVQKFKDWKEEEKRLKFGKDAASEGRPEEDVEEGAEDSDDAVRPSPAAIDEGGPAAKQLRLEASANKPKPRPRIQPVTAPIFVRPPTPEGPFTSFFSKPHLRAAAIGDHRHGRSALAFGQPIPDFEERDFDLPPDYTTPAELKESARRRRRMKRESLIDSTTKA